jgi:hypothetical protein
MTRSAHSSCRPPSKRIQQSIHFRPSRWRPVVTKEGAGTRLFSPDLQPEDHRRMSKHSAMESAGRMRRPTPQTLEWAQGLAGPIRLHTPSAELRALDKLYDHKLATGSQSRPLHTTILSRRAQQGSGYYSARDPANPKQVLSYSPAIYQRSNVAGSVASASPGQGIGVVARWEGGAPGVRHIGGTSTQGRDLARSPLRLADPQIRELRQMQAAWQGQAGFDLSRARPPAW